MPIDAVITWVNGQDVLHRTKRIQYALAHDIALDDRVSATRFNACGELDYCVRSILYFAPWLRTIYLVTDNQRPDFLTRLPRAWAGKIQCVDHRDIFSDVEHCLPSFNSLAIETLLWRIPQLAEQFIYFNDDVLLLRAVSPSDFFYQQRSVLRGAWKPLYARGRVTRTDLHRSVQQNAAEYLGFTRRYWRLPHVPHALQKSLFTDFFATNPAVMTHNVQFAFRDQQQYSPVGLHTHLSIQQQRAVVDKRLQALMIHAGVLTQTKIKRRLRQADTQTNVAFACLQSLDEGSLAVQQMVFAWLDERIPAWDI